MFSSLNLKSSSLNPLVASLFVLTAVNTHAQQQQIKIGDIEYFGTKGVDVQKLKTTLPIHEGEALSFDALPDLILRAKAGVKESIGREATDVEAVCCDVQDNLIVYIGLPGRNLEIIRYNSPPKGTIHFPDEVLKLYGQTMDLIAESVHAQASEDRSQGYALSTYPPLRTKQLAMREYATRNFRLIRQVLNESSNSEQRTVAAHLLGYAVESKSQIRALVKASHDRDEAVRNNAVRALGVLAESRPSVAKTIPAVGFLPLLNSGIWRDRNKGSWLLEVLTKTRDPNLLRLLSGSASDSLLEMAEWRQYGHAISARLILGRIAGMEEDRLQRLAHEDPNAIIKAFRKQ